MKPAPFAYARAKSVEHAIELLARPDGAGGAITTGDPDHPANAGRLCSKGFALEETLGLDGRLLHPMLRRADRSYAEVDWDTAIAAVADGFRNYVDERFRQIAAGVLPLAPDMRPSVTKATLNPLS